MTGCGCSKVTNEQFEFKIRDCDKPQIYSNCQLLPNTNDQDLDDLINKIICDFQKVIKQLECGIQPDIELILEEISLIYMNNCKYNVTKKMLATDPEEDNFLRHLNYLSEFSTQEEKDQVLLNLGIYDKVNALVTRDEVHAIVENRISEVASIVNELNRALDKKIGFVTKIDNIYYGFSDSSSFMTWMGDGSNTNSSLILAKWELGNQGNNPQPITVNTSYYGNKTGELTVSDLSSFQRAASKSLSFGGNVSRGSTTYIVTTYNLQKVTQSMLDNVTSNFQLDSSVLNYSDKQYKIYKWTHESAISLDLNITLV